jgi:hypothetical protein
MQTESERGSALLVSLILTLLLVMLGSAMLTLSGVESNISHNDLWSEGTFQAAEAGANAGIDQLAVDPVVSVQPIAETFIVEDFTYRSGARFATAPEAFTFLGKGNAPGYSAAVGTGYNASGYSFSRYRINATGAGPRDTSREVEVQARYGPVPE